MAITTYYCSWDDVVGRLSADGAAARIDDDPARQTDILRRATLKVNQYALLLYGATALAASDWVREVCADIGWFFASTRRNNPPSKAAQFAYDEAIDALKNVQRGSLPIPDAAMQKAGVPVLSNQRVKQWPVPHPVNVEGTSTGTREGYVAHNDAGDWLDYSI